MRGLRRSPRRRIVGPSGFGLFFLLSLVFLVTSCGPKKPAPTATPEAAVQPSPPSPVEALESKVLDLEVRQMQLKKRRSQLEEEFAQLKQKQRAMSSLREEVLEAQRLAAERAASMREVEAEALEPKKPPEKAEAPAPPKTIPPTAGGRGATPYVVHTASFKNPKLAFKTVRSLTAKGYPAYHALTDLGPKGLWHRVLVGRFATVAKARQFAARLKEREKLSYAAPMRLPYAVELEAYPSADVVKKAKTALEDRGVHSFVVEEQGPNGSQVYRLRVGAYGKKAEAEAAAKKATQAGAKAAVIRP